MPKFQQIMQSLREINFDLDDVTEKVESISRIYAKKTTFVEEETKDLLDRVDRELGYTSGKKGMSDRQPRNFHAPESPVRRVFENGVEIDSGMQEIQSQYARPQPGPYSMYYSQPRSLSGGRSTAYENGFINI